MVTALTSFATTREGHAYDLKMLRDFDNESLQFEIGDEFSVILEQILALLSARDVDEFSARENLFDSIADAFARKIPDDDLIAEAEKALMRLNDIKADDAREWATRLASDLSKFDD
jgi:hypothetical protein